MAEHVWIIEVDYAKSPGGWEPLVCTTPRTTKADALRCIAAFPQLRIPPKERTLKYRAVKYSRSPSPKRRRRG